MDFFFGTICPTLGVIISNIQLASPFKAVLECRKAQSLGPLNPVPLAVSFVNLFGIVVYGGIINDMFILLGVSLGVGLNFIGCTTAIALLSSQGRILEVRQMERLILSGVYLWVFLALAAVTFLQSRTQLETAMGITTCATTILYYCAPLSSVRIIIAMRDATSLYLPMLVMNLISASLWFSYGLFGAKNIWIYLPNALGLVVTLVQLSVKLYYGSSKSNLSKSEELGEISKQNSDTNLTHHSDANDTQIILNNSMGMGLGGMGGIGGVGLPGLVGVEITDVQDIEDVNLSALAAIEDVGMSVGQGIAEFLPAAASGVAETMMDVGNIVMAVVMPPILAPYAAMQESSAQEVDGNASSISGMHSEEEDPEQK